jgi:hypothetical protein
MNRREDLDATDAEVAELCELENGTARAGAVAAHAVARQAIRNALRAWVLSDAYAALLAQYAGTLFKAAVEEIVRGFDEEQDQV